MRRVDRERGQQREYIVEEVILDPASLGLGDVAAIDQNNADLGQDAAQVAPDRLLVGGELGDRLIDQDQLLGRGQTIRTALGDALPYLGLDAGDADHEELIKVIGGNRQKPHPFQRGMARIDRLLQHPAIEMQPGKLAIDEALGAGADRRTGLGIRFFFFNYSSLRGIHQISIHLGKRHRHPLQRRCKACVIATTFQ
jgi:hypothetical protein